MGKKKFGSVKKTDKPVTDMVGKGKRQIRTSLFRAQVDEMLSQLTGSQNPSGIEKKLHELYDSVKSAPKCTVDSDFKKRFPQLHFYNESRRTELQFVAPTALEVVGSFLLRTYIGNKDKCVDLLAFMPQSIFYNKDHINYKYADKRSAYLGVLQEHLKSKGESVSVEFIDGNIYRPALVVSYPTIDWKIRILLGVKEGSVFESKKLAIDKNCLRRVLSGAEEDSTTPSPHYNSTLLEDMYLVKILNLQHEVLAKYGQSLRNAIVLLKHWLKIRGLTGLSSFGCHTAFAILACHICVTQRLADNASSMQIFKLVLTWIVQRFDKANAGNGDRPTLGVMPNARKFEKQIFPGSEDKPVNKEEEKRQKELAAMSPFERAIAEAESKAKAESALGANTIPLGTAAEQTSFNLFVGELNVFYKCPPHVMLELDMEARITLKNLDETFYDQFDQVFGKARKPELNWDVSVEFPLPTSKTNKESKATMNAFGATWTAPCFDVFFNDLDFSDMPFVSNVAERICAVMVAGLRDRVLRMWVRLHKSKLVVGLKVLPKNIEKTVIRGPSADATAEVKHFKAIWGAQKPEIRRFKDGRIEQCLAWQVPENNLCENQVPNLVGQMIDHLLGVHFPAKSGVRRVNTGPAGLSKLTLEGEQVDLWKKFQEFRDMLTSLQDDLSLGIGKLSPAGAGFSYTEKETTEVVFNNSVKSIQEIVCEFDWSSKWPRESEGAIKVFQGAFLLEIAEALREKYSVEAFVGDEGFSKLESLATSDAETTIADPFLDVVFPRHIFRVRAFYPYLPSVKNNAHFITFSAHLKKRSVEEVFKSFEEESTKSSGSTGFQDTQEKTESTNADSDDEDARQIALDKFLEDAVDMQNSGSVSRGLSDLREMWWRPRVRQGFHNLVTAYPAFAPTVKLVCKWLSSHMMLDGYEDFVEHTCALLFSRLNNPFCDIPTTANVGLARFLYFIHYHLEGDTPIVLTDCFFGQIEESAGSLGLDRVKIIDEQSSFDGCSTIRMEDASNNGTDMNKAVAYSKAKSHLSESQIQVIERSFERRKGKSEESRLYCICSRYDPHGVFVRMPQGAYMEALQSQAKEAFQLLSAVSLENSSKLQNKTVAEATLRKFRPMFSQQDFDIVYNIKGFTTEPSKKKRKTGSSTTINIEHRHFGNHSEMLLSQATKSFVDYVQSKYAEIVTVHYSVKHQSVGLSWRREAFSKENTSRVRNVMNSRCNYIIRGDGKKKSAEVKLLPDTKEMLLDLDHVLEGLDVERN